MNMNSVSGGLSKTYHRATGIPQVCRLSMMTIMLLLGAWVVEARSPSPNPETWLMTS